MIEISLLDKFEIIVNGRSADSVLSGSKKGSQMLIYLLINYGKAVSSTELYDVLWPGETSTNPENALKTLISRVRSALTAFAPELRNCIVTSKGSYRWNSELECNIDTNRVEKVCKRLLSANEDSDEVCRGVEMLLTDYSGDLCVSKEDVGVCLVRKQYYHDLFTKSVIHVIELCKKVNEFERIVQLTRTALDIDMFEERFHIELIEALVKSSRSSEALAQYRYMSNLHYSYMGMAPSENLQGLYTQIMLSEQALGMDIDAIKRNLEGGEERKGAFVCEYSIFKDVYRLQMRNLQRMGTTMYLAVVMLSPSTQARVESLELDKAMHRLLEIMVSSLRKGDTISRYSPSQFAVLLPTVNDVTGRMVIKRVRTLYYSEYVNPDLAFSYKLVPLGDGGVDGPALNLED